jgi:hypothetical protein
LQSVPRVARIRRHHHQFVALLRKAVVVGERVFIGCVFLESRLLRGALEILKAFLALDGFRCSILTGRCQRRDGRGWKAEGKAGWPGREPLTDFSCEPAFLESLAPRSRFIWALAPFPIVDACFADKYRVWQREVSIGEAGRCEKFCQRRR